MKRFSIFCAALFVAATSFAAVAYELNGGVTNDYGWMDKGDMYEALNADFNAYAGTSTTWKAYEEQLGENKSNGGIPTSVSGANRDKLLAMFSDAAYVEKWGWLATYLDAVAATQYKKMDAANGVKTQPTTSSGAFTFSLGNFFGEDKNHAADYIDAVDFSGAASKIDAFQATWKHGFDNPAEPTGEWVLNAPYKEGESFLGWFWNADFSGDKVTTINAESNGTLYAKFGEYIPTIAEVKAMADSVETKVSGVVNFISGKNLYIQDATGGILVYATENPTCKVGDNIVVKGQKVIYGGAPEVKGTVLSAEASELPAVTVFENLAALLADTEFKNFATRVSVPGVKIVSYDSYNNPTVEDALGNKAVCYKMVLDPTIYPIGTKVTVTAVAGWFNGFQFVGDVAGIEIVVYGKKENYTYPTRANGRYTLENNWVISLMEDNFAANKPGGLQMVRGMAAKDGIMYFISRETESIIRVSAATGEMLDPIKITGDHVFEKVTGTDSVTGEQTWGDAATLPYNDLKFDQAGHCLIGACVATSGACQPFQIYTVDLETGEAKELINDVLWENPGLDSIVFRFDAFGVAGDVTKNGVVMAADATNGNWLVYRWLIKDGVVGEGEQVAILLDPATDQSLYIDAKGFGGAPQIFPQDKEGALFYVDGFNTLPMLFYGNPEEGAILVDDFINVPAGADVTNNEGEVLSMNTGHNGLIEFQVGDEYFLLMAASNTAKTPPSAFALYKFADADREFSGMEPLWYFPHNGLGSSTNQCRTAVPSVEVKSKTEAVLYIYVPENGYATYTLTIDPTKSAVEDVEAVEIGTKKVLENGQIFILKNGVKYNALGAEVK